MGNQLIRLQVTALIAMLFVAMPCNGRNPRDVVANTRASTARPSKSGTHNVVRDGRETEERADRFVHPRIATDATRAHNRAQDSDDPFDEPGVAASEYVAGWLGKVAHIPAATINSATLANSVLTSWRSIGVVVSPTGPDSVALDKGNVVSMPEEEIVIATHEGQVHISPGSVAFVMETADAVSVYDLHDGHKGGVKFLSGARQISLVPGQQLVLSKNTAGEFNQVNPAPQIAHCNQTRCDFGSDLNAYTADFSILSALLQVKPLQSMLDSDKPEDQEVTDRLIKNAVILADLNSPEYKTGQSDEKMNSK